ncbi:carotenoid oxygenase family protein [Massilia sp. PAMC28688]|uniref:carotenoid oxygenase family protein n=1 Tax=Massilia sp. PAMC28688 TaxID=2861283 RepID=UPI001C630492|nr:carotenoid oxygenase family protein [Massilia sp. PAMC28688]QYF93395.1 carotenoid oxygenase family protein [Massilia sp. PAMC28688]
MDRRAFLHSTSALAALSLVPRAAMGDALALRRFHAALEGDPALAVFANTTGDQSGSAQVHGKLPGDLRGVFYRNGPGRFELGGERYHHWFDGDGFAQRWEIADGQVKHRGKFVLTQKFVDETAAGQFLYPTFGTHIARRGIKGNDTVNAANTNLLPFNGRVYALWEGGSATELDPVTLATVGIKTWSPDMKSMPFSAHPKVEPGGAMWNFGTMPGSDKLVIYRISARGVLEDTRILSVPQLAMVHDFVISARHLIFLIPPYDMVRGAGKSFADMHQWAGAARPLRAVVVDKATLAIRKTFELPPHMVFHFGNAWDDGDCTRLDLVLHQGDALRDVSRMMRGEQPAPGQQQGFAAQLTLDHRSGTARMVHLLANCEFPRVMPQVVGTRHRKLALLSSSRPDGARRLDTVNLIDTSTGRRDSHRFGPGWQVEEHVLVARRHGRGETDAYLVGVAQDTRRGHTVLTVFDARRVSDGPLALARLPYRAPHCFHGNFLPA